MRECISPFERREIKCRSTLWLHGKKDQREKVDKDKVQIILDAIAEGWDVDIEYADIEGELCVIQSEGNVQIIHSNILIIYGTKGNPKKISVDVIQDSLTEAKYIDVKNVIIEGNLDLTSFNVPIAQNISNKTRYMKLKDSKICNATLTIYSEFSKLRKWATVVISWLIICIILSIVWGAIFLSGYIKINDNVREILLCIIAGTLGSSISAIVSAAERIAHGWEFSDGFKYPNPQPADKFVAKMVPIFLIRPFLGSAMGLIVYVGIKGGYFIAAKNVADNEINFTLEGLMFLTFIGGFMAKTLMEKMRNMFDALFGK